MSNRRNGMNGYQHFLDRDRKAEVEKKRQLKRQERTELVSWLKLAYGRTPGSVKKFEDFLTGNPDADRLECQDFAFKCYEEALRS